MLRKRKIFLAFKLSDVVFILPINVKMPTTVGILTFITRINSCSVEFSMKKSFIISRSGGKSHENALYGRVILIYTHSTIRFPHSIMLILLNLTFHYSIYTLSGLKGDVKN